MDQQPVRGLFPVYVLYQLKKHTSRTQWYHLVYSSWRQWIKYGTIWVCCSQTSWNITLATGELRLVLSWGDSQFYPTLKAIWLHWKHSREVWPILQQNTSRAIRRRRAWKQSIKHTNASVENHPTKGLHVSRKNVQFLNIRAERTSLVGCLIVMVWGLLQVRLFNLFS